MRPVEAAYKESLAEAEDRDDLLLHELPQVYYIANRIKERLPQHVELEDLVSAGVVGLLEAYRAFDSSKNTQFKTFAKFRIRGAILDSLREADWGSRSLRKKGRAIAEVTASLGIKLGREPLEEEIAAELNIDLEDLWKTMTHLDGLHITGRQYGTFNDGAESIDLIESAPSLDEPDPYDLCLRGEMESHLADAVGKLSEREQLILSLYYQDELTMREIAEVVGLALSRISQVLQSTLKKLRESLAHLQPPAAGDTKGGSDGQI